MPGGRRAAPVGTCDEIGTPHVTLAQKFFKKLKRW